MLTFAIGSNYNQSKNLKLSARVNRNFSNENNTPSFKQFNSEQTGFIGFWYKFFSTNETAAAIFIGVLTLVAIGGYYLHSRSQRNRKS